MARSSSNAFVVALAAAALIGATGVGQSDKSLELASDAFTDGKMIPPEYTCDGADRSPAMHWDGAPEATKALALIVEDPDAPGGTFTHWVLYNVPPATRALSAGVSTTGKLGDGSLQGTNDFGKTGYGGPCPPAGATHRYVFELFALSEPLDLQPGAKRDGVLDAIKSKKLASAKLTGRYARSSAKPSSPQSQP